MRKLAEAFGNAAMNVLDQSLNKIENVLPALKKHEDKLFKYGLASALSLSTYFTHFGLHPDNASPTFALISGSIAAGVGYGLGALICKNGGHEENKEPPSNDSPQ